MVSDPTPIRDAASVIVLRQIDGRDHVLMGRRGGSAAFMPSKFVFPGGAVDKCDHEIALAEPLSPETAAALSRESTCKPEALWACGLRETFEEAGLIIGTQAPRDATPAPSGPWQGYCATGHWPTGAGADFLFRAITPEGRPRRFDARFFVVDAAMICGDPDDFSRAEDELDALSWVALDRAQELDLPFITRVILGELRARRAQGRRRGVAFFDNRTAVSRFCRL